jgi:hypothetical protein
LPQTIQLEPKDSPVLLAAINGKAHYLLTGDAEADRGRLGAATASNISSAGDGRENAGFALLFRAGFVTDKFCYQS